MLSGCGKISNFGLNKSFFSELTFPSHKTDISYKKNLSNKQKITKKSDKISSKSSNMSVFKNIDNLNSMSISEIEQKFGEPSFVIYNSEIGDEKTSYYFMSWYYISYEIEEDNISHNHTIISSKSLIIRFDSTLTVVGAQLVDKN